MGLHDPLSERAERPETADFADDFIVAQDVRPSSNDPSRCMAANTFPAPA